MSTWYTRWGKRALDVTLASLGIMVLSPLLLVIALLVRASVGTPVVFRQRRSGRFGEPFHVLKFRSMRDDFDANGSPLPDDVRLTRLGRFLRASSLDELPSLFNVLWGEMSIVGPRPLLVEYNARYSPRQIGRLSVRPGITGLAQVRGRQALRFSDRIEFDLDYVERLSPRTDLEIVLATIPVVLGSRGVINGQLASEVDDLGPARTDGLTDALLSELQRRQA